MASIKNKAIPCCTTSTMELDRFKQISTDLLSSHLINRKLASVDLKAFFIEFGSDDKVQKSVAYLISRTFLRYEDTASRRYIFLVINEICNSNYLPSFMRYWNAVVLNSTNLITSTKSNSIVAFTIIRYTLKLLETYLALDEENNSVILENLFDHIKILCNVTFLNLKIRNLFVKYMKGFLKNALKVRKYILEHLFTVTVLTDFCFLSICMQCALHYGTEKCQKEYKNKVLPEYSKLIINSKVHIPSHILLSSEIVIKQLDENDVKNEIIPAIDKNMLRNPEITIYALNSFLQLTTLNISCFCNDIFNHIAIQLRHNDDAVRNEAVNSVKSLSNAIDDLKVIKHMVRSLFDILNGSNGKITSNNLKISIIEGIKAICANSSIFFDNYGKLVSSDVCNMHLIFLSNETNESLLSLLVLSFASWCKFLDIKNCCKEIITFLYEKCWGLKNSTSLIRKQYINILYDLSIERNERLVNEMIKALERGTQNIVNNNITYETIAASSLLLKFATNNHSKPLYIEKIIMFITNDQYSSMKVLGQADANIRLHICRIVESLFKLEIKNDCKQFIPVFCHCLLSEEDYKQRRLFSAIINFCIKKCNQQNVVPNLLMKEIVLKSEGCSGKVIFEAVLNICCAYNDLSSFDKMRLLFEAAIPMHCDQIDNNKFAWKKLKTCLIVNWNEYTHLNELYTFIRTTNISEAMKKALRSICIENFNTEDCKLINDIISEALVTLKQNVDITIDEKDIAIMNHSPGDLWDISVLTECAENELSKKNIKRENKLYSYKEQLAEIELRRELNKKRLAEGKSMKLTKKQEEIKQTQLKIEEEIRYKLKNILCQSKRAFMLLDICSNTIIETRLKDIVDTLKLHLKCYLTANLAINCMKKIAGCLWNNNETSCDSVKFCREAVATTMCRIFGKQPLMDEILIDWKNESIFVQIERVLKLLSYNCSKNISYGLSFLMPLIKFVMMDENFLNNNDIKRNACSIIIAHCKNHNYICLCVDDIVSTLVKCPIPNDEKIALLIGQTFETSIFSLSQLKEDEIRNVIKNIVLCVEHDHYIIRKAGIVAIEHLMNVLIVPNYDTKIRLESRVFVAKYDGTEEDYIIASEEDDDDAFLSTNLLATKYAVGGAVKHYIELYPIDCSNIDIINFVIQDLKHDKRIVRQAASNALIECFQNNSNFSFAFEKITSIYKELCYVSPPILDEMGRVVVPQSADLYEKRLTVIYSLYLLSVSIPIDENTARAYIEFYLDYALNDRNIQVRERVLFSAKEAIEKFGGKFYEKLIPTVDKWIQNNESNPKIVDEQLQCAAILLGNLGNFLKRNDPRIRPIISRLIKCLNTPSNVVQMAVAQCLSLLADALGDDLPKAINNVIESLYSTNIYAERCGCAYGLGAFIKAYGIQACWDFDLIERAKMALLDKKHFHNRESALLFIEKCCYLVGKSFEAIVAELMPLILDCCSDSNKHVRLGAEYAAKGIMSNLTNAGVKLLLPNILNGLTADSWRTKVSSIEMLGAVAFCDPKQLSDFLPLVVPKLISTLSDSHQNVTEAGRQSLSRIGTVIKNDQVQNLVPVLLDSIVDPVGCTAKCLQTLVSTRFSNHIDPASLALIMPVIQRSFSDRNVENRKMASNIVGNLFSIASAKHVKPYLSMVLNGLKYTLVDPAPEVRANSAAALSSVYKTVQGFEEMNEFAKWLKTMITNENNNVDRSGAAQGMAYIWSALNDYEFDKSIESIVRLTTNVKVSPFERDGYLQMFLYLPETDRIRFEAFIPSTIVPILTSLSDENEYVRDTALKCGTGIINNFNQSAIDLMLPELEKGVTHENWRIRLSSIQLMGDLLYTITGVSGKMSTETADDDDSLGTEKVNNALLKGLGVKKRDSVLAALYMTRSDITAQVRNAGTHVWKAIVSHTPKTLKEILPVLFQLTIDLLSSDSNDKRQVAARSLGDVVKKLGEKVLIKIIPILESGLNDFNESKRHGVCVGFTEVIRSSSKDHLLVYADILVPSLLTALMDKSDDVRERAAEMFQVLYESIGNRALEEILPKLMLNLKNNPTDTRPLDALRQLLKVKSRVVLPSLIPVLLEPPLNTTALSHLANEAGDSLGRFLPRIISSILKCFCEDNERDLLQSKKLQECTAVLLSSSDNKSVIIIVDELCNECRSDNVKKRFSSVTLLWNFLKTSKSLAINENIDKISRVLFTLYLENNEYILLSAANCLSELINRLDFDDWSKHVSLLRQNMRFVMSEVKQGQVPGFGVAKIGLLPLCNMLKKLIMTAKPDVRECAALMLYDALRRSPVESIKESATTLAGPVIRLLCEKYAVSLKMPLVDCLILFLDKVQVVIKMFLPQVLTVIGRSLSESNRPFRIKATCLAEISLPFMVRVTGLLTDIVQSLKLANEDVQLRDTYILTLRHTLMHCFQHIQQNLLNEIIQIITSIMLSDNLNRHLSAGCLGVALAKDFANQGNMIKNCIEKTTLISCTTEERYSYIMILMVALKLDSNLLLNSIESDKIIKAISSACLASKLPVNVCGLKAIGYALNYYCKNESVEIPTEMLDAFNKCFCNDTTDVRQTYSKVITYLAIENAKEKKLLRSELLETFAKNLLINIKDKNTAVRFCSEVAFVQILNSLQSDKNLTQETINKAFINNTSNIKEATDALNRLLSKKKTEYENYIKDLESLDHTVTL